MLDLKFIRENPDAVREMLKHRNMDVAVLDDLLACDKNWRGVLLELEELKIVFVWADFDAYTHTHKMDVSMDPGENVIFNQTWVDYPVIGDVKMLSGIFLMRYDLHYTMEGLSKVMEGVPFYVRLGGNPLVSVTGAVTTLAMAQAGISMVGLVSSIQKSLQMEVNNAIESTQVSPTDRLMSYYRSKSAKNIQNEITNAAFGYAKLWKGDKCPSCGADWPEGEQECSGCEITQEKAQELYSKTLADKSLMAGKEVVDSVSGLSLSNIAQKLGEGVTPTTDIISVLTYSGLALAQPRVAKSWSVKTRKLVFTGFRISIFTIFWVQACGIGTISLTILVVAILTGTILPLLFSKGMGNSIKTKVNDFWKSKEILASNGLSRARA